MNVSYRWLKRHVDLGPLAGEPEITAGDVAALLNLSTAEVEGVERFAPVLGDVVVGHVVERARHPNADKLSVCHVDVGGDAGRSEVLQIVCGAANVAAGQRVAVARAGTRLPGDVHIKRSKIRDVESQGMICSERELMLGDEHDGIWVLPGEPPIGRPVAEAIACEDWVLTIDNKSLTHRPDLWGHRGIATELAAITGRPLASLAPRLPAPVSAGPGAEPGAGIAVKIESAACARYLALELRGVANGRSPTWLRLLLLAAGQRPIDLLVDLSNFVMLDLGQPNHAFDRRAFHEGISVRDARPGERLTTLDGIERALGAEDLLICDGARPVALAGVMGGAGTKVAADTSAIVLEVASFDYARVRRTAQRLALRTEASARFEKQLSPTLVPLAAAHFCALLSELQPGLELAAAPTDVGAWKDPARTVRLRPERARAVLGSEISDPEIERILAGLGLAVARQPAERAGEPWEVSIPSARATKDLTIEEDLIEEIGRIHRYGRIPEHKLVAALEPPPRDERRWLVRAAEDRLAGAAAFRQALTYSFVAAELEERLRIAGEPALEVENPVAAGVARIRRSVAPSLIALVPANLRERGRVRLFEIGKGYHPEPASARGEPREVHEIALVEAGPVPAAGDFAAGAACRAFENGALPRLTATVSDLLAHLKRPAERLAAAAEAVESGPGRGLPPWLHPLRSIAFLAAGEGAPLAIAGELEPGVARALELQGDAAVAVVALDRLLELGESAAVYRPPPSFPAVKLDVALALAAETPAARAVEAIERAAKGQCGAIELFDVFQGASVGSGKKSLAFHLELAAADRTLGEKDVHKFLERLAREAAALGGELRRE